MGLWFIFYLFWDSMAERAGFEPAIPQRGIPVFETGAFNHSATSPQDGDRTTMTREVTHVGANPTKIVLNGVPYYNEVTVRDQDCMFLLGGPEHELLGKLGYSLVAWRSPKGKVHIPRVIASCFPEHPRVLTTRTALFSRIY